MKAPPEYLAWMAKADHDLLAVDGIQKGVKKLAPPQHMPWDVVCFLAQQAAEKYLKAFLVLKTRESPRVHSTVVLGDMCRNLDPGLGAIERECIILKDYAVEPRYPSALPDPTEADGRAAIAAVRRIRDEIRKRLPAQEL
jgi:HEPN domain-containing protein